MRTGVAIAFFNLQLRLGHRHQSQPKAESKLRNTQYDILNTRLFMQNEPNFNPRKLRIHYEIHKFYTPLSYIFFITFPHFLPLITYNLYHFFTLFLHIFHFLNFCTQNILNSMYDKDLHKYFTCLRQFYPKIPLTRGVYPPFIRREKTKNKPNPASTNN
jgi:hypothetical protein